MSFTRARALRSLHASLRHTGVRATPRFSASGRTQLAVTKRFASGGGAHGHAEPSSDIPWLVGGIAVTVPACWYLWPTTSHADHHDAHGEEAHEAKEDEAPAEDEAPKEESEAKDDEKEDKSDDEKEDKSKDDEKEDKSDDEPKEKSEGKDEKSEGNDKKSEGKDEEPEDKGDDKEESNDDSDKSDSGEGGSDKSGMGKGKGKNLDDTRKREPDSKGGFKKRIDSGLGKDLGKGSDYADSSDDEPTRENAATAKQPQKGKAGEISGKQFGLSTTATRHSTQIDQDPEKSKKGDGSPETAKAMGTVDVNQPAR